MKKIIFIFIFTIFSFNLSADMLLENKNICISDYWYAFDSNKNKNKFYYVKSSKPDIIYSSSSVSFQHKIFYGFYYDVNSSICAPVPTPFLLGIDYHQYKFLMAITGLLVAFSFLFSFLKIFSRF